MKALFEYNKGIVVALDTTDWGKFVSVLEATKDITRVVGYKVGCLLGLSYGLGAIVEQVKNTTGKAVIYDHQKGATDIPDLGTSFAKLLREAEVDSAILFPLSGPITQEAWTTALMNEGIVPWIGGHMTHKGFLDDDDGGYIGSWAPGYIYDKAARMGVRHFIVPGNQPNVVASCRERIQDSIGSDDFFLGAPGFVKQGGSISDGAKVAGDHWVAIIGRDIVGKNTQDDIHTSTVSLVSQLGD